MDAQRKQNLSQYVMAAKAVIYETNRARGLLEMLDTPEGAIQAVQTVVGAIDQKKPVPPDVAPLLGVSVYMLLVDLAHNVTGEQPDANIVKSVIGQLMATMAGAYRGKGAQRQPAQAGAQPGAMPPPQAPRGLLQTAGA